MERNPNNNILQASRLARQILGGDRWKDAGGKGTLHYYMGFGKTMTAIMIIKKVIDKTNGAPIVILVPSETIYRQWASTIKVHLSFEDRNFITVSTVHEFVSNPHMRINCHLLVIDELHEFETEERLKVIKDRIVSKFTLGLSGTLSIRHHSNVLNLLPIVDTITKQECVENGWISKYREYNLATTLNEFEQLLYDRYTEQITKFLSKFGKGGLALASMCVSGGKDNDGNYYNPFQWSTFWAIRNGWRNNLDLSNPDDREIADLWEPQKVLGYARNAMKFVKMRKDLIYNAENKFNLAVELLNKFPNKKAIIFNQSTNMADRIGKAVDKCVVFHSNMETIVHVGEDGKEVKIGKTRRRKAAIDDIKTGKANRISTVNALNSGFDVQDISLSVTTAGTQNPFTNDQRNSRATRLNPDKPDDVALIVNIYIESTKEKPSVDEKWLRKRQVSTTHEVIWVDSIEEIREE